MTREQFLRSALLRDITTKKKAEAWLTANPRTVYSERDLQQLYRDTNKERRRSHDVHGLWADGQDGYSPGNFGHYGSTESFEKQMTKQLNINDKWQRAWHEKHDREVKE